LWIESSPLPPEGQGAFEPRTPGAVEDCAKRAAKICRFQPPEFSPGLRFDRLENLLPDRFFSGVVSLCEKPKRKEVTVSAELPTWNQ
jgi:hypothetical protein